MSLAGFFIVAEKSTWVGGFPAHAVIVGSQIIRHDEHAITITAWTAELSTPHAIPHPAPHQCSGAITKS